MMPRNIQQKGLTQVNCVHKMKMFITFYISAQCVDKAFKICEEQEIATEELCFRKTKGMSGEHAKDVGLSTAEEINQFMLQAVKRFHSETDKRFSEISLLNETK